MFMNIDETVKYFTSRSSSFFYDVNNNKCFLNEESKGVRPYETQIITIAASNI